jgi:hypothetical protein
MAIKLPEGYSLYKEDAFVLGEYVISEKDRAILAEAVAKKTTGGPILKVTLPVGFVDKVNDNQREYAKQAVVDAFEDVKTEMATGGIHGQIEGHPDGLDVSPHKISHLITKAWVDDKNFIWNEWVVPGNSHGKDLASLFLAGTKIGVSTRGAGMGKKSEGVEKIIKYKYAGTDGVGRPSTGIKSGTSVPNVTVEVLGEETLQTMSESLKSILTNTNSEETVMTEAAKTSELSQKLGAIFEEVKSLKDQMITSTTKTEASKDLAAMATLKESLDAAMKKVEEVSTKIPELEGKLQTVTEAKGAVEAEFKKITEAHEKAKTQIRVSTVEHNAKTEDHQIASDKLRTYAMMAEEVILESIRYAGFLEESFEKVSAYGKTAEKVLEESINYIHVCEQSVDSLREYALKLEKVIEDLRAYAINAEAVITVAVEEYKKIAPQDKAASKNEMRKAVEAYVKQNPSLQGMRNELLESATVSVLRNKVNKYLGMMKGSEGRMTQIVESRTDGKKETTPAVKGWR